SVTAHFATVLLIFAHMRKVQRSGFLAAFVTALYFSVGPGLYIAAAYLGTPVFAFFIALSWCLAQRLFLVWESLGCCVAFSLVALIAGLTRPEGVLTVSFMVLGALIQLSNPSRKRLLLVFGSIFLVLGGSYLAWRWHYFGNPLPNPFYVKGQGHLHWD